MPKIVELKKDKGEKKAGKKASKEASAKKKEELVMPDGLPAGKVVEIKLSEINLENTEYQFRVNLKVNDLIKSIRKDGQQFPIILRGNKPYQIVSGFRRTTALRELGAETVKAIIRDDLDDERAFAVSFIENERKKNLSSLDKAHAVEKLKRLNKKREEIARIFDLSEKQISRYEEIAAFPDVLKKAIGSDKIQAKHGLLLNQYYKKFGSRVNLDNWVARISEKGLSSEDLKKELAREVRGVKKTKKFFEKRKDGFRLFPMSFDPKKTLDEDKEKMKKALKSALDML